MFSFTNNESYNRGNTSSTYHGSYHQDPSGVGFGVFGGQRSDDHFGMSGGYDSFGRGFERHTSRSSRDGYLAREAYDGRGGGYGEYNNHSYRGGFARESAYNLGGGYSRYRSYEGGGGQDERRGWDARGQRYGSFAGFNNRGHDFGDDQYYGTWGGYGGGSGYYQSQNAGYGMGGQDGTFNMGRDPYDRADRDYSGYDADVRGSAAPRSSQRSGRGVPFEEPEPMMSGALPNSPSPDRARSSFRDREPRPYASSSGNRHREDRYEGGRSYGYRSRYYDDHDYYYDDYDGDRYGRRGSGRGTWADLGDRLDNLEGMLYGRGYY